jgi:hypothetical protein
MNTLPIVDLGSSGEGDQASLIRIVADVGAAVPRLRLLLRD